MKTLSPTRNNKSGLLRWTHQGQRYSITWGDWNNPVDRTKLELVGKMIYQDCLLEVFDETLIRYKAWLNGEAPSTGKEHKAVKKQLSLITLLEERLEESYKGADLAVLNLVQGYGKSIETPEQAKNFIKWVKKER